MKNKIDLWVNQRVFGDVGRIFGDFSAAKPFPHVVINNFLKEARAEELLNALRKEKFEHKESDLFSLNQTADFSGVRTGILKEFYSFASSSEFADFMHELTGLKVRQGALDLAGSLYKSGDYLLCHDDQVEDRNIAYILYLSKYFKEPDGGRFVLFDSIRGKPGREVKKYVPEWNSMIIFEVSKVSFHAVEENMSDKNRYAIGGWLH